MSECYTQRGRSRSDGWSLLGRIVIGPWVYFPTAALQCWRSETKLAGHSGWLPTGSRSLKASWNRLVIPKGRPSRPWDYDARFPAWFPCWPVRHGNHVGKSVWGPPAGPPCVCGLWLVAEGAPMCPPVNVVPATGCRDEQHLPFPYGSMYYSRFTSVMHAPIGKCRNVTQLCSVAS